MLRCVHHSDHGSQYVSLLLSRTMWENGIRPSMGPISSPWDNAAMESLMGIVKSECVHARVYATRDEAALDIFEDIEVVYNRARTHSALGYMSPAEFEEANWPDDEGRPNGLGQYNGHGESSVSIGKVFKLCQENATTGNSSSPPRD